MGFFMRWAMAASIVMLTGCLPYITQNRAEVTVDRLNVDDTLIIAERELAEGGFDSVLTLWAIRDQDITPMQAEKISVLYFEYIDTLKKDFSVWHLTWAIADMYRLGNGGVKSMLQAAYEDATRRASKVHRVADKMANGNKLYMGDAHGGGRAYAKGHLVAPGNEAYLQSIVDYEYLKGNSPHPDAAWGTTSIRDFTPRGWVRQPSFISHAGMLNKNEHALLITADGELIPPAMLLGYRYGLLYWWEVGFDVGGDVGVFEGLAHMKMENFKTGRTEIFYWGTTYKTGYKHHEVDWGNNLEFDDTSWVIFFENSFALRLGNTREKALFLVTQFYIDKDLHAPRRQTDYYLAPALVGWENVVGNFGNFFIQGGMAWSINGMEMADGRVLYDNAWFPVLQIGFGYRSGERTAIYYAPKTRHMAKR